ncbi:hypothetical protein GCM10009760_49830 [Kitasatospora kazusensis]|uniref:N-acetyltransferase domain-containing protein n=1 Tax=Kitasatospora kazusensis TaxID=407974 RepID=A0ABP5LRZ7_9ACTN
MTEFEIITDTASWQSGFERRLRSWYGSVGYGEAAAGELLRQVREDAAGWTVARIGSAGAPVGWVAVGVGERDGALRGRIGDLWVDPAYEGLGHERAARAWAERRCTEQGARSVHVRLTWPAGDVFADYPVRAQSRMRVIDSPAALVHDVTTRPVTGDEYPAWLAGKKAHYVTDIVRSGARTPEEARQKSDEDYARLLPDGPDTAGHTIMMMEVAGEVVGTGWLHHGHLPGVSFGYSLDVYEEQRGKGYGRDAMAVGERVALAGGDSALMFNVWGGNEVAMSLYTGTGYLVVEETRSIDLPAG